MTIERLRLGACFALLVLTSQAQAVMITGSISESDFFAFDSGVSGGGTDFYLDAYTFSVDAATDVTITMAAGPTLAPWLYLLDGAPISASTPTPLNFNFGSALQMAVLGFDSDNQGGTAMITFAAAANTLYQIGATSQNYYPDPGSLGDYTLMFDAADPNAAFAVSPVAQVNAPATLALMVAGLLMGGIARARRNA